MRGGRGVGAARWEGLGCGCGTQKAPCTGVGPTHGLGAKGTRGAHPEHVGHARDAGGVEAQRLVEGRHALPSPLPSRREGMRCGGGERCEPGGGTRACGVWWRHGKRHAQEACTGPDSRLGGQGHARRAHVEHGVHGRDAGGVKAQRLVEARRLLPSRREGTCDAGGRGASREAGGPGVWWRHDKRHARGIGPTHGLGAKGTRGAHAEHVAHVSDPGGVKAQRLVEGLRVLPSRREGMRCGGGEVRAGRREGLWCGGGTTRGMHVDVARLKAWGPRARAERTPSM